LISTVLAQAVVQGTVTTASVPNPGTSSGGAVTGAVFGLRPEDLADPALSIVLTVQMQFGAGGDFQSQPLAEYAWQGGPTVAAPPSVSWRNPYYRRVRIQVDVSRPVSLGVRISTP
jgi:hypothetical protein